jgi:hypothetical protein
LKRGLKDKEELRTKRDRSDRRKVKEDGIGIGIAGARSLSLEAGEGAEG